MTLDLVKSLAVKTALAEMLKRGHFNICTINQIVEITGVVPDRDLMKTLQLLHCVDFSAMAPALRKQLPDLIRQALRGVELDVDAIVNLRPTPVIEMIETAEKEPWYKRLTG